MQLFVGWCSPEVRGHQRAALFFFIKDSPYTKCRDAPAPVLCSVVSGPSGAPTVPLSSTDRAGMNEKKAYEVGMASRFVHRAMGACDCHHVIDVGAGKGYLSKVLAYGAGMAHRVCAVDCSETNVAAIERLGQRCKV